MTDIKPGVIYDIIPFTVKQVGHLIVYRVSRGWLMAQRMVDPLVFVPFHNEFMPFEGQEPIFHD